MGKPFRIPRHLFSTSRRYDPEHYAGDVAHVDLDDSEYGADRNYDKRNGNVSEPGERDGRAHVHRAQQEIRRKHFDFKLLLKHWGR